MWQTCTKYSQWIRDIVVKNVGDSFSSLSSISVSFYPQPLIVIKHKVAQPETTSKLGTVPYKNSESSLSHPGTSKLRKSLLLLCVCVWHVHNFQCHNRNYGHDSWSSETSSPFYPHPDCVRGLCTISKVIKNLRFSVGWLWQNCTRADIASW